MHKAVHAVSVLCTIFMNAQDVQGRCTMSTQSRRCNSDEERQDYTACIV